MTLDWLLVGALGPEVLPLVGQLEGKRPVGHRLVLGRLAGARVGVLRCGVGPEEARARTAAALAAHEAAQVMSLGTCGALRQGLPVGTVVGATQLFEDLRPLRDLEAVPGLAPVACTTVRRPVVTPAARRRLAEVGADVCEMEAAAVAEAAGTRALTVIKVVSDLAGGSPDPALTGSGRVSVARFKLRALRLSQRFLTPAVVALLRG